MLLFVLGNFFVILKLCSKYLAERGFPHLRFSSYAKNWTVLKACVKQGVGVILNETLFLIDLKIIS